MDGGREELIESQIESKRKPDTKHTLVEIVHGRQLLCCLRELVIFPIHLPVVSAQRNRAQRESSKNGFKLYSSDPPVAYLRTVSFLTGTRSVFLPPFSSRQRGPLLPPSADRCSSEIGQHGRIGTRQRRAHYRSVKDGSLRRGANAEPTTHLRLTRQPPCLNRSLHHY